MDGDSWQGLSDNERELLCWLLPESIPACRDTLARLMSLTVLGEGRWGHGHLVFGHAGDSVDRSAPVERVFAFGVVEYEYGTRTVTVHDESEGRIEVQFSTASRKDEPGRELRRYSYSPWTPGMPGPAHGARVHEYPMSVDGATCTHVFAVAPEDSRLWMHARHSGHNRLLAITAFHNNLMRATRTRDPRIALNPAQLFETMERYTAEDFAAALRLSGTEYKGAVPFHERNAATSAPRNWLLRLSKNLKQ